MSDQSYQDAAYSACQDDLIVNLREEDAAASSSFVVNEDLAGELIDFVRLTRCGHFLDAERIYTDVLSRHEDQIMVVVERAESLLLNGDFTALKAFVDKILKAERFTHEETHLLRLFGVLAGCRLYEYKERVFRFQDVINQASEAVKLMRGEVRDISDMSCSEVSSPSRACWYAGLSASRFGNENCISRSFSSLQLSL